MTERAGAPTDADAAAGARVLVAEDEQHLGLLLEHFLAARGHAVVRVRDGRDAVARLTDEPFDAALVDLQMPGLDGLSVLRAARALALPPQVAVVTGHGSVDTAIEAMRLGAYDYVTKPYRMAEVDALVRRMLEKRTLARDRMAYGARLDRHEASPDFVTVYAPLCAVLATVERAAAAGAPALLSGEPGTGKSLLARRLYARSDRPRRALVMVDCQRLTPTDSEGSLFGDVTTTNRRLGGLAAAAEGGTLVLEHVDALSADAQRALARVLAADDAPWRPRVVATTNDDPARLTRAGRLDPAVFESLSRVTAHLPPLRDRPGDVRALVDHFASVGPGARQVRVTPDALAALERRAWPGNVPELRAVVEGAVARAEHGVVDVGALLLPQTGHRAPTTLAAVERELVVRALETSQWHRGEAARALGVSARTLYRMIRRHELAPPVASGRVAAFASAPTGA